MYLNLRAEMARQKVTLAMLAEVCGVTVSTMSQKNCGKSPFTFDEACAIKKALHTDLPLEVLFAKEEK